MSEAVEKHDKKSVGCVMPGKPRPAKRAEKFRIVLTWGGSWAEMFEQSLARKMAAITHLGLNLKFKLTASLFTQLVAPYDLSEREKQETYVRLNSNNAQSSELLYRFKWFVDHSTHVFLDNSVLDTAMGHQLLLNAVDAKLPVWAVGVDSRNSPLAPAFLNGIMYPASADDVVHLVLRTESPKPTPDREEESLDEALEDQKKPDNV
jgi:hypothetical protein